MFEEDTWKPAEVEFEAVSRSGQLMDANRGVVGIHCDRDEQGYTRVIYYSDGRCFSINSPSDVEAWLEQEDDRLLFNVDRCFLDSLLKWFGESAVREAVGLVSKGYTLRVGKCRIRDYRRGRFTVYKGNRVVKRVLSLEPFYHMSHLLTGEEDCYEIEAKARRLMGVIREYDIPFTNLISVGGMLQGYLVAMGARASPPPREVQQMASNAYHTQWVTAYKVGHFDRVWDYDLNAAFAYEASNLLSSSPWCGKWVRSSEYQEEAAYGFCYATIKVVRSFSPLLQRVRCELGVVGKIVRQLNCSGVWRGFITKEEIEFLEDYLLGEVEIHDGWWFLPEKEVYPFREVMLKVFALRNKAKQRGDKFAANLFKLLGVAIQGKFLSCYYSNGRLTKSWMYNPVYAASIVARTRLRLFAYLYDYADDVVHVGVDGATLTRKLPEGREREPGMLRLNSPEEGEECIVVGDGEYWIPSRQSVLQKSTLEAFSHCGYYPDKSKLGLYTMWSGFFHLIGRPRPPRLVKLWDIKGGCHRIFDEYPKICGDLLRRQYGSRQRFLQETDCNYLREGLATLLTYQVCDEGSL